MRVSDQVMTLALSKKDPKPQEEEEIKIFTLSMGHMTW